MPDVRRITFVSLSSILLLGTFYSVAHHTWLDTSDPLLALSRAPHPLHETHYFARKDNLLNTIFIKQAWGWTSAALLALAFTVPPPPSATADAGRKNRNASTNGSREMRTGTRLKRWAAATAVWLAFTTWFFGPALLSRVTAASGGECVVRLPSGAVLSVPADYCNAPTLLSPATHPDVFASAPIPLVPLSEAQTEGGWSTIPRLMRGHDVSGHVFLLTLSLLVLADAVTPALTLPQRALVSSRTPGHWYATLGACLLMLVWLFALLTTAIFFHSPFEKFTGYRTCHFLLLFS